MAIALLKITNFRNLSEAQLEPALGGLNIIYGDNGSGKTSLLEAIYYIGLGRSFRSSTSNRLIKHDADKSTAIFAKNAATANKFVLFAQLVGEADRVTPVGVERDTTGATRLRVDEKEVTTVAELASFLPIQIINSHSHQLLESGPAFRRKFLDWGLFYQEEGFLPCWRHFERVLKQRNAVLRDKRPARELSAWTADLVKYGLEMTQFRQTYVQKLTPFLCEAASALLGLGDLQVSYFQGWSESEDYSTVLAESASEEYRLCHTQYGPHRADLEVKIDGISVRHFLSRGQQKLLVCAMMIAQGMLLSESTNRKVIYLIDDLPAELDMQSRNKLISLLSRQKSQVFITAIEKETICDFAMTQPDVSMKVFHVEHGEVVEGGLDPAIMSFSEKRGLDGNLIGVTRT